METTPYLNDNFDPVDMTKPEAVINLIDDMFGNYIPENVHEEFLSLLNRLKNISIEKGKKTEVCYAVVELLPNKELSYKRYFNKEEEAKEELAHTVKEYSYDVHAEMQKAIIASEPIEQLEREFIFSQENRIEIDGGVYPRFTIKKVYLN